MWIPVAVVTPDLIEIKWPWHNGPREYKPNNMHDGGRRDTIRGRPTWSIYDTDGPEWKNIAYGPGFSVLSDLWLTAAFNFFIEPFPDRDGHLVGQVYTTNQLTQTPPAPDAQFYPPGGLQEHNLSATTQQAVRAENVHGILQFRKGCNLHHLSTTLYAHTTSPWRGTKEPVPPKNEPRGAPKTPASEIR